ncbi:Uncharacterised protein [Vibrio cholerae]|nr:Uncharacterised protein [Vibrio cholerae]
MHQQFDSAITFPLNPLIHQQHGFFDDVCRGALHRCVDRCPLSRFATHSVT